MDITVLPQEGHWTHDELFEEDTFIGSVQFLISPVASDRFPSPVLPFTLPVRLTIPLIPGYAWVGVTPPPSDSPAPEDSPMPDSDDAASSSSAPREIPLSAYPPYDPVTGCGFLLPGVPIDWSKGAREDTPLASGGDIPTIPPSPAVEAAAAASSEEEEDPSEGSSQ